MKDSIKIYSLPSCGVCLALKRELDSHNIPYTVCQDVEEIKANGITSLPTLQINEKKYGFKDALKLIKGGELNV